MFNKSFSRSVNIVLTLFIFTAYSHAEAVKYLPMMLDTSIVVLVPFKIKKPTPIPKGRLKKTGQTKSYNSDGVRVIDGSIKDDGYYQAGVSPRYTRYKDVVTDHVTGLHWQDNSEVRRVTKTWQKTKQYCSELNLNGVGWRVPNIHELQTIVVYGAYNPSIDTNVFLNYYTSAFWSSTLGVGGTSAWRVNFEDGDTDFRSISFTMGIRCVR